MTHHVIHHLIRCACPVLVALAVAMPLPAQEEDSQGGDRV